MSAFETHMNVKKRKEQATRQLYSVTAHADSYYKTKFELTSDLKIATFECTKYKRANTLYIT